MLTINKVLLSDDSHTTEAMKVRIPSEESESNSLGVVLTFKLQTDDQLCDTAQSINAVPRQASQQAFIPIGHISIDSVNAEANHLDLDIPTTGVFWIKTFYVSRSVRGQGIGRAAMDAVEVMAIGEPLNARTLMLDTVHRDDQKRDIISSVRKVTYVPWVRENG